MITFFLGYVQLSESYFLPCMCRYSTLTKSLQDIEQYKIQI